MKNIQENTLFDIEIKHAAPLAERMRPQLLKDFVGQKHIVSQNTVLHRAIKADRVGSCIFWGPPGTGKTTLANVIANTASITSAIRQSIISATVKPERIPFPPLKPKSAGKSCPRDTHTAPNANPSRKYPKEDSIQPAPYAANAAFPISTSITSKLLQPP